jgi:hypothetical protein
MEHYEKLKQLVESMEKDVNDFYSPKGNGEAGKRARAICQEIKTVAQELREDIQNIKNSKKNK